VLSAFPASSRLTQQLKMHLYV